METYWISHWFQRLLRKQSEVRKSGRIAEQTVFIADRLVLVFVVMFLCPLGAGVSVGVCVQRTLLGVTCTVFLFGTNHDSLSVAEADDQHSSHHSVQAQTLPVARLLSVQ